MAKTEIIGSWYNSGFHGHYRSRSRNDFYCEYRQLAKPQPPKVFTQRSKEPATKHTFSKHDNRHSFMNDALYFEQGVGRKRLKTRCTSIFNPDLLTWMPMKPELERGGPKKSLYKLDYRGPPPAKMTEMIVRRPKTSFDDDRPSTTSYRYSYGNDHPHKELLSVMNNNQLTGATTNRIQKRTKSRDTVSTCLNWVTPRPTPCVPASTQVVPPTATTQSASMETSKQEASIAKAVTAPAALQACQPAAEMAAL